MRLYKSIRGLLCSILLSVMIGHQASAQNLAEFEKKVTEFTLDNGLHFIIIERHEAPVASFYTHVNVGGADEPVGNTGIAHIFEHMAFKGTKYIGTTNWDEEKKVIAEMDETYKAWLQEKFSSNPDENILSEKWAKFEELQEKAKTFVVNNEFSEIIQNNGGTGLNASTGSDLTNYYYSLPSNKAELWFNLEADRFKNPTYREFYVEKEVVREERRMRIESNPIGRLIEEFVAVAFTAHPYGRPVVGWNSDITATTIEDARDFYDKYYVPSNITIAIAGDVDPKRMKKLAEEYFGDFRGKGKVAPPVTTVEPTQRGERRFTIEGNSQPIMLIGYHGVSDTHEDFEALSLLGNIISSGRTSVLYQKLVEEEKLALQVAAFNGFPGTRFGSLFLTLAVPNQGVELDTLEQRIYDEIEIVKGGSITQEELDRARTNIRAGIIRGLANNTGLALNFASTYMTKGDWRDVFLQLERYNAVTLEDLQRVANQYLIKQTRTVGATVKTDS
ncbi:MAG: peptidase M16 [Balneola sp.]|jgi:predicted Zn-dependent peptidase|nr:peptidase M16 [Balneola sp.]MAO77188.1 peptidase M16 [Balneola sp.]MBF63363.1 peptidase M16 [Balneola sp.]|tara:strand:- start:6010 stop:7518 length:1509 start_codon:yes stop_codon:yes gene_type:complete